jgi:hypothetical protein
MVDAPTITPQEKERENCQRLNNKSGWVPPPKVGTANGAETVTLANVQIGRLFLAMSLPLVACERYIHVHHRLSVPASAYQRSNAGRNDSAREKPCENWPTVITASASFYSMEVSVSKSDFTTYLCRGSVLSELDCQGMCLLPIT